MRISLIIPVLDEEESLRALLPHLPPEVETIVVDGGSRDRSRELVRTSRARLVCSPPGRGSQFNRGAEQARGDILLFVHCDTRLPGDFQDRIRQTLDRPHTVAGAFSLRIDAPGLGFRLIECGANLRSRWLQLPYGDQGLFMNREIFQNCGGYPDQPLLEDVSLAGKLRKIGRITICPARVLTSARRWRRHGLIRTTVVNQLVLLAFFCGMAPATLARFYYGRNRMNGREKG